MRKRMSLDMVLELNICYSY